MYVVVRLEVEQRVVSRNDQLGLRGKRAGEHLVVVRILRDSRRY